MPTCEEIIKQVITAVKSNGITEHVKDELHESWTVKTENAGTYKINIRNRTSKTQREFNKAEFLKVNDDGSERVFNLGEWKKKQFYTLVYCLKDNKVFNKITMDPSKVKLIAEAIKHNPNNWERTESYIKGTMDNVQYEIKRERKEFNSGKILYRVKLFENGVESLKGSQLMKLWR